MPRPPIPSRPSSKHKPSATKSLICGMRPVPPGSYTVFIVEPGAPFPPSYGATAFPIAFQPVQIPQYCPAHPIWIGH